MRLAAIAIALGLVAACGGAQKPKPASTKPSRPGIQEGYATWYGG